MKHEFQTRKGQSAIEYLMTYGWMLLVVAIVGGAIFATVQGQCAEQASGFTGQSITVPDFGVTDTSLVVEVKNGASDSLTITNATLSTEDGVVDFNSTTKDLGVGATSTIAFDGVARADGCNNYDLEFDYDQGDVPGTASGSISGKMAEN